MKRIVGVLLALCLTGGCEYHYWYQEGKTFDECKTDRDACRTELLKRSDLNYVSRYEMDFMKNCMEQRGYRLVGSSDLPLDVKRQEPDTDAATPIDRAWGVAGSLSPPGPAPAGPLAQDRR